jgi:hypothetical protein
MPNACPSTAQPLQEALRVSVPVLGHCHSATIPANAVGGPEVAAGVPAGAQGAAFAASNGCAYSVPLAAYTAQP